MKEAILNGPWTGGINSLVDPSFLPDNQVQWSVNTINRGGNYQTRPGYRIYKDTAAGYTLRPRGMAVFTPKDQEPFLVKAVGTLIRVSPYPFTTWTTLTGVTMDDLRTPVIFETAVKGAVTHDDGTLEIINPYPVLMIQNGNTRAAYWDGVVARHLDPTKNQYASETPIGTWMKWIGSKLWVAQGSKLRVSNILDPLKFTEEDITSEGGTLSLGGPCTGLGSTADQQALLAFTSNSTSSFQASILDRAQWQNTDGFKTVILPDIGCAAGLTIVNQFGITWWLSQGGLIGLDGALQTYRTSKITFKDNNMARSKGNISDDVSGSCAGAYGNFLVLSVPSGDTHNAHTWVMDESVVDELNAQSAPSWASCWTGTRPVQWVSTNIFGQPRCFFLSRDYPPASDTNEFRSGVWEAFCGIKFDYGITANGILTAKPIQASLETKLLAKDASYKTFEMFKVRLKELSGSSHLDGFYASAHAGYKQVLDKDIIATTDSLNVTQLNADFVPLVPEFIPQVRTVRSGRDDSQLSDLDQPVEDSNTRDKDVAFSVLLKWNGQMSIPWIALYTNPSGEDESALEEDETTIRTVAPSGESVIGTAAPKTKSVVSGLTSKPIKVISPRWTEDAYSSNS